MDNKEQYDLYQKNWSLRDLTRQIFLELVRNHPPGNKDYKLLVDEAQSLAKALLTKNDEAFPLPKLEHPGGGDFPFLTAVSTEKKPFEA